jgi:hypothetical protein
MSPHESYPKVLPPQPGFHQHACVRAFFFIDGELISKPGCPIVVYFVSGQPVWEGKADGVSGVDG